MNAPTHTRRDTYFLLAILAIIWGSSYILMKRGLLAYTPQQIGALRIFTAGLVMLPFAWRSRAKVQRHHWQFLILTGLLGNAIPSILFPLSETRISSALAGMINTLTPLFTLLVGFLMFGMQATRYRMLGLLIGLAGAVLLILGRGWGEASADARYSMFVVLATACYAFSVNILRHKLHDLDPISTTSYSLLLMGTPMWIYLFTTDFVTRTSEHPKAFVSMGSILLLGMLSTAFSTVLFNRLIKQSGALVASSVTYLAPAVAALWGLLDNEVIGLLHLAGLGLILSGVYLIGRGGK